MMSSNKKKCEKIVKEVAAIRYLPGENSAPEIVALGRGETAEIILEKAKEANVPVVTDPELAHTLNKLNIGQEIPVELYEVVAEILSFISNINEKYGDINNARK